MSDTKVFYLLLVEDTSDNLDVAKKFFDSLEDVRVDYATNTEDAVDMLNKRNYNGVITDRSIPQFEGQEMDTVKNRSYFESQGWLVAFYSTLRGVTWVMHSEHGSSFYYVPENLSDTLFKESLKKTWDLFREFKTPSEFSSFEWEQEWGLPVPSTPDSYIMEMYPDQETSFFSGGTLKDLTKTNEESWAHVWKILKKRI